MNVLAVARSFLRWRVVAPAGALLYRAIRANLSWWPAWLLPARAAPIRSAQRIAYYYHGFPILSETFIQREVTALRASGVRVDVIAHGAHGVEHFDSLARTLHQTTHYIPPMFWNDLPPQFWQIALRRPLRLANAFVYLVARQHSPRKSFRGDRKLFHRAVQLAGVIEQLGITHVHCPWANHDATIAMVAARLANIRYSVQARASDIHHQASHFGLRQRLRHAAFVITNSRYNQRILRSLLAHHPDKPIHVIHNGIDLTRFRQPRARAAVPGKLRLLAVGRLTAPKGFDDLLRACRLLLDRGCELQCEIIGGRVALEVNHYLELRRLHRDLRLAGRVRFVGGQSPDQVLAAYCDADVLVLPAVQAADGRREITPNVVIEAMAMKLAVVSTTVGALPELVEDGVSGLLVPPRDPEALAAAIRRLQDSDLRAQLGDAARRRVEQRFDLHENIRHYVSLFGGATDPRALADSLAVARPALSEL